MSIARRHQARVLASMGGRVMAAAGVPLPAGVVAANDRARSIATPTIAEARAYQMQLSQLGQDERRLKSYQSIERKIAAKREMLPAYAPWVEGRLSAAREGGQVVEDAVVATVMVWRLDIGDWTGGLEIAAHVLQHGLTLPARFTRQPAVLIAEMVADAACAAHTADQDFPPAALGQTMMLTYGRDMPDQVLARLHKAMGQQMARALAEAGETPPTGLRDAALQQLRRARELDPRAGVAALIKRLEAAQLKESVA